MIGNNLMSLLSEEPGKEPLHLNYATPVPKPDNRDVFVAVPLHIVFSVAIGFFLWGLGEVLQASGDRDATLIMGWAGGIATLLFPAIWGRGRRR
jgi:hypothetical protein